MPEETERQVEAAALVKSLRLSFKECKCNPHKHYVLYEGEYSFHGSYPLYARWAAAEQVAHYAHEGLLDFRDEELCEEGLQLLANQLDLPTLYEGSLPKAEWDALVRTKCTTARRSVPSYLIE